MKNHFLLFYALGDAGLFSKQNTSNQSDLCPPPNFCRFGCKGKNQVKLRTNVLFSMKLSLSPFLSKPEQNSSYSSYSLYAVVVSKYTKT